MPFQPLSGIRIVDVTTSLAGPYCTELLGALGADVIKIEPPGGDESRTWGPPFWGEESAIFLAMNANKRSLALDLRRGVDVLRRLTDGADVALFSLRPGAAEERGLGARELRRTNPRLVYCTIGAFGNAGPWQRLPGYDPLAQAAGGIISVTGEPDGPPVRVGVSLIDQGTGLWAAFGVLAALHDRERTGEGRAVDVSLFETALGLLAYQITGYLADGTIPGRHGTSFASIAPYKAYRMADGALMVAAGNDRLFAAFAEAVGRPELATDSRFVTNADRVRNRDELDRLLEEALATEPRAVWQERLERAGVPVAPVQHVGEVAEHEQTEAIGILQELEHPAIEHFRLLGFPLSLDGERVAQRTPPPALGQHTREILVEAGYPDAEVDRLAAEGIVALG